MPGRVDNTARHLGLLAAAQDSDRLSDLLIGLLDVLPEKIDNFRRSL